MNENKTYIINTIKEEFDTFGLKLYHYPKLASMLSYEHLKDTDQGVNVILQEKYAWAIVVMKLHLKSRIKDPTSLVGRTWYSGRKGPYYRREYELTYHDEVVVAGASYSILLNVIDRSIYRLKQLPFKELNPIPKHLVNLQANFRQDLDYENMSEGVVIEEYIDALGHTNHLYYVEFIYNALTEEDLKEVNRYNTMELFFHKEMVLGDVFTVNKGYLDEFLIFLIYNKTNEEKAFTLKLSKESL